MQAMNLMQQLVGGLDNLATEDGMPKELKQELCSKCAVASFGIAAGLESASNEKDHRPDEFHFEGGHSGRHHEHQEGAEVFGDNDGEHDEGVL